jgi:hypothetical protein
MTTIEHALLGADLALAGTVGNLLLLPEFVLFCPIGTV